jgi:G:T-mismatch repair DNA endonuclease (very short patch repair protein)
MCRQGGTRRTGIEVLLDAAMRHRLPPYEIQGEICDPSSGALVTRPDMLFPDQRVAVYADGYEFHSTPEQIAHDQRVRTRARELGYRILAFPGKRIVHEPAACVDEIVKALQR